MTKKLFLVISALINFALLGLCAYFTFSLWASLNGGSQNSADSTGFAALGIAVVMVVYGIATVILFVTLIFKLIAVKVEHNAMTFFAMLFDIAAVIFAAALNQNALEEMTKGNIGENIVSLIIVGVVSLPLICDLISFAVQKSD